MSLDNIVQQLDAALLKSQSAKRTLDNQMQANQQVHRSYAIKFVALNQREENRLAMPPVE